MANYNYETTLDTMADQVTAKLAKEADLIKKTLVELFQLEDKKIWIEDEYGNVRKDFAGEKDRLRYETCKKKLRELSGMTNANSNN